jgi:peptidoglycan hydrolase CwlO-like protein
MNKPEPLTDEQIAALAGQTFVAYMNDDNDDADTAFARAIEAAVNRKWEEMLSKQEPVAYLAWRDGKPCYEGDDAVCEDAVWPVDIDDDRTSMPVYAAPVDQQAEIERLEKELSAVNECLWGTEDDVISLRHQLDDQQAEIERLKEQNYKLATAVGDQNRKFIAAQEEIERLRSALVDLVEAGEEAWGDERPCVKFGRAALGEQK